MHSANAQDKANPPRIEKVCSTIISQAPLHC